MSGRLNNDPDAALGSWRPIEMLTLSKYYLTQHLKIPVRVGFSDSRSDDMKKSKLPTTEV